jgi:hypothetical protein
MTRNLKALLVSAMAVLAMGAVGAQGAQGALFHSEIAQTTLTVKTDGELNTKTAHQVLDYAAATVTCAGVTGHGQISGNTTATAVTFEMQYESPCAFVGQAVTLNTGSCDFTYTSHGTLSFTDATGGSCAANPASFSVPSPPCTVTVSNASGVNQNLESVAYHNIGSGTTREITVEPKVTGIHYTALGAGCPKTGTFFDGARTTANFRITGEAVNGTRVGVWLE